EANNAVGRLDGGELLVRQVAGRRRHGVGVRVRGNERIVREGSNVPEAALRDVRQVEHDAQLVAALDERPPVRGEAWPNVGAAGEEERHAETEEVRPTPDGTK